jgi:hypothetical protein
MRKQRSWTVVALQQTAMDGSTRLLLLLLLLLIPAPHCNLACKCSHALWK